MSGREGDILHEMLGHIKGRLYFFLCGEGWWVMDAGMVGEHTSIIYQLGEVFHSRASPSMQCHAFKQQITLHRKSQFFSIARCQKFSDQGPHM